MCNDKRNTAHMHMLFQASDKGQIKYRLPTNQWEKEGEQMKNREQERKREGAKSVYKNEWSDRES